MDNHSKLLCDRSCLGEMYDFVVVGSGLTAAAFVHRLNTESRGKRILVLEAGSVISTIHFQQSDEQTAFRNFTEAANYEIGKGIPALVPYRVLFGGRTMFWTAWAPRPTPGELSRWPASIAEHLKTQFDDAESFLGIQRISGPDQLLRCKNLFRPVDPSCYSIEPAPIARGSAGKFSAIAAWDRIAFRPARNTIRIVCNTRVDRLLINRGQVVGVRLGTDEHVFKNADFLLCTGTLENLRLSKDVFHDENLKFACHGVVSFSLTGKIGVSEGFGQPIQAYLVRPIGAGVPLDHHFQISAVHFTASNAPIDIHRISPDVLELSPTLVRGHPDSDFACSITCLFEFSPKKGQEHDLNLSRLRETGAAHLSDPESFNRALTSQFKIFQRVTEEFVGNFLDRSLLSANETRTYISSRYVVHDTIISEQKTVTNVREWRRAVNGSGCNLYVLGSIRWPSIGTSNPAMFNVASAFALARELS